MNSDQLLSRVTMQSEILAISILLLAIVLLLWLNRVRIRLKYQEMRVQRALNEIGTEQIRNLVCPDGLDGYLEIDRLALTRDAIVIINYKRYEGRIYCAEKIAEWTQVLDRKSFKFENPLFELDNQLTSLRMLCAGAPVNAYLFFNHNATFPKGRPESILSFDAIPESLLPSAGKPANPVISNAWEALKTLKNEEGANNHISVKT